MSLVERIMSPDLLTWREQRARALEAAALEIDVRGWSQYTMRDEEGSVCLVGGICALYPTTEGGCPIVDGEVLVPFDFAAAVFGMPNRRALSMWNDAPGRTAKEVTFVLRWRAAEIRDGR